MTSEEMVESKKPKNVAEFYENITNVYKKRSKIGELVPCDSGYLAYGFEISVGTKRLMPEVGAQSADARVRHYPAGFQTAK